MAGRSVSSRNRCPRKQSVHWVTACVRAKVWASLLTGHVMPKKRGHWHKCLPQRCQKAVGDARLPLKTVRDLGAWNSLELICMRMNLLFTSLFLPENIHFFLPYNNRMTRGEKQWGMMLLVIMRSTAFLIKLIRFGFMKEKKKTHPMIYVS